SYMHKDAINWENIGVINNYPDYCAYRFPVRFVGLDAKASLVLSIKEAGRKYGLILQVRDSNSKETKTTQTKVTVECFRHRMYSDPKEAFRKRFSSQATVADHVVRQTLRDNGASSRGSKGKSMTRKSKSRRSMKKEDCCPFWFAIVCSISNQYLYLQYQRSEIKHPGSGCLVSCRAHTGHCFLPGTLLANTTGNIDEENKKLALELYGGEGEAGIITAQQVAMFLSKRTGLKYTILSHSANTIILGTP
ncbi:MAG: hypothetical protein ACREBR_02825, partial [bacterium]